MYQEKLQQSGLTGNEAKVYEELLRKGELSANQLAKNISIDRSLSYTILNHLLEKGLVNYIIKSNKKFFKASDPSNLLNSVKAKEIFVKDLIYQLKNIEKEKDSEQEINIYEGKDGMRSYTNLILKHKEVCSFGGTGRLYDLFYESPAILTDISKKGIFAKMIIHSKYAKHEMNSFKGIHTKFLDLNAEATTSIFGNYIAIHLIKNKSIVIVIKNKEIADSYRAYFGVLWKIAKK